MSLHIRGVHHIVLTVSDPARSAAFYERILGVPVSFSTEQVRCLSCSQFLLCLQRPPKQPWPNDRFDENQSWCARM